VQVAALPAQEEHGYEHGRHCCDAVSAYDPSEHAATHVVLARSGADEATGHDRHVVDVPLQVAHEGSQGMHDPVTAAGAYDPAGQTATQEVPERSDPSKQAVQVVVSPVQLRQVDEQGEQLGPLTKVPGGQAELPPDGSATLVRHVLL